MKTICKYLILSFMLFSFPSRASDIHLIEQLFPPADCEKIIGWMDQGEFGNVQVVFLAKLTALNAQLDDEERLGKTPAQWLAVSHIQEGRKERSRDFILEISGFRGSPSPTETLPLLEDKADPAIREEDSKGNIENLLTPKINRNSPGTIKKYIEISTETTIE